MSRNFTPDETLIDQLLLDDTSAFEELHHRYCYSLYIYCAGKLNSPGDAKRIVRDVFISLWENRHCLPVDFSISLHLYTEVRKAVVKCINKKLLHDAEAIHVEKQIIPGFTIQYLQTARQPVTPKENKKPGYSAPEIKKRNYENLFWSRYWAAVRLKGVKHAFQSMLNLW